MNIWGSQKASQKSPKSLKIRQRPPGTISCLAGGQPNITQNDPKMSQKSIPKRTPEDQNDAPKRYWISGSTIVQILSLLVIPKASQKATNIVQKSSSAPQRRPKASRDPPELTQGVILGSREFVFKFFKRPFRSLRAPHHTIESTVRHHFSKDPLRPLRGRCAQHRWLSGRFGAAGPLGIRPLSLQAHLRPLAKRILDPESSVTSTPSEAQRLP